MRTRDQIESRIDSIGEIQKLTRAMYHGASLEFKSVQRLLSQAEWAVDIVLRAASSMPPLDDTRPVAEHILVVVTSNRSRLADQSVLDAAEGLLGSEAIEAVVSIGEAGREFMESRGFGPAVHIPMPEASTLISSVDEAAERIYALWTGRPEAQVRVAYSRYKQFSGHKARVDTILPAPAGGPDSAYHTVESLPLSRAILNRIYLRASLFLAVTQSYSSFMAARMASLERSSDNAEQVLADLKSRLNRARQGEITAELIETVEGVIAVTQKEREVGRIWRRRRRVR